MPFERIDRILDMPQPHILPKLLSLPHLQVVIPLGMQYHSFEHTHDHQNSHYEEHQKYEYV